jgi:vacuolar protein sorting-associated protein IST1
MDDKDEMVTDRIVKKLSFLTPSIELVDSFLHEIAKGYSVKWSPPDSKAGEVDKVGGRNR